MSNLNSDAKRIFYTVLDQEPSEWETFLRHACAGNPELRRVVDALISAHRTPASFLERPLFDRPTPTTMQKAGDHTPNDLNAVSQHEERSETSHDLPAGSRFRILYSHARGGFGEVFVAEDCELRREVVLKEIRLENAQNLELTQRFVFEAEVTSHLEHPGIVPVYGAGSHSDGRPYYAMRFVRGETLEQAITRFHSKDTSSHTSIERSLEFRQLLSRFVAVCQAVGYAHSKGVIHRDLKPSNVMLGKYGETLIVDWGLAKVMGAEVQLPESREDRITPSDNPLATRFGITMGTPSYMSPEQATGRQEHVGLASDVYSLGATLYILLCGRPPFESPIPRILREVKEGRFPGPRQVNAEVSPALEAVCLKAMACKPSDRYAGAMALAHEVENWLADEPVSAWREPRQVRASRWVRKHQRLTAATVTLAFTALLVGSASAIWYQKTEAARQGRAARLAETMTAALDQAEEKTDTLSENFAQPNSTLELMNRRTEWNRRITEARHSWERARLISTSGESPPLPPLMDRLLVIENQIRTHEKYLEFARRVDLISLSAVQVGGDGAIHAEEASAAYTALFRDILGVEIRSNDTEQIVDKIRASPFRQILVTTFDHWATCSQLRDSPDKDLLPILFEIARKADPHPWRDQFRQRETWGDQAKIDALAREVDLTAQPPQTISALAFKLLKPQRKPLLLRALLVYPNDFWLNFDMYRVCDDPAEKVGYLHAALVIRPDTVLIWNNLGTAFQEQGNLLAATDAFRKAIAIDPAGAAIACLNLGTIYLKEERWQEGADIYQLGLKSFPRLSSAQSNFATALMQLDRNQEAIQAYQRAIKLNPAAGFAYAGLGQVCMREGQYQEATKALGKALDLIPKSHPSIKLAQDQAAQAEGHLQLTHEHTQKLTLQQGRAVVAGILTDSDLLEADPPNSGSARKAFSVTLLAGKSYQIDASGDFESCLRVENNKQWCLRFNDQVNPSNVRLSRIVFTPVETAEYKLVVASRRPGEIGSFTLSIAEVAEVGQPIVQQVIPPVEDVLTGSHITGEFDLDLVAGRHYAIAVQGSAKPRFLEFQTPNGKSRPQPRFVGVKELGVVVIDITPITSGKYSFRIESRRHPPQNQYTLHVQSFQLVDHK